MFDIVYAEANEHPEMSFVDMEINKDNSVSQDKKTYYVTYKIDARYVAEVEAGSIEEAKANARFAYESADFGEASDIDGEIIIIEDQDGNFVYEK